MQILNTCAVFSVWQFFGGVKCVVFSACIRVLIHSYLPRFPNQSNQRVGCLFPRCQKGPNVWERASVTHMFVHLPWSIISWEVRGPCGESWRNALSWYCHPSNLLLPIMTNRTLGRPCCCVTGCCLFWIERMTPERDLSLSGPSSEMLRKHRKRWNAVIDQFVSLFGHVSQVSCWALNVRNDMTILYVFLFSYASKFPAEYMKKKMPSWFSYSNY